MFLEILCTDFGEMAALQKFRFTAATLAMLIIPFATMLTAANLSQSYQITTHCTTEFVSIHSISKTALAIPCWWLCCNCNLCIIIIIIMINLELFTIRTLEVLMANNRPCCWRSSSMLKGPLLLGGCLAYQNSRCFFSFLQIICSLD